jgi:ankyrin repeat protein
MYSRPIRTSPLRNTKQHIKRNAAYEGISLPPDFTFLHFALLADAPRVTADLMRNGADINQDVEDYPDLTPLYLTLPRSLASSPKELDSALRIACIYALPRTTGFLLIRGANANTLNTYGFAAIHTAVMRRCPWRKFPIIDYLLSLQYRDGFSCWESMLLQTVSTLLDFGADIDLRTQTSRTHECDPKCWRSIDCDHQMQTALHIASASGVLAIVSRLLDAGADPNLPNGQGYTVLYVALVQGHEDVAYHILKRCNDPVNPIVCIHEQTTALHVACRFSFPQMVDKLLGSGADANVIDSHGRTPLHDILAWARWDREEEAILTLGHLAKFGADPDITTHSQTPRQLAEIHTSMRVTEIFLTLQKGTQVRHARRNLSFHNLNVPKGVRKDVRCSAAQCELSAFAKYI